MALRKNSRRPYTGSGFLDRDTATLDAQLDAAASYYSRELDYKLKKLTSLAEPAIIVFMGVVVGFVAVALVSAMYGVFNNQKSTK